MARTTVRTRMRRIWSSPKRLKDVLLHLKYNPHQINVPVGYTGDVEIFCACLNASNIRELVRIAHSRPRCTKQKFVEIR